MNIESYLNLKNERKQQEPKYRVVCKDCRQPDFSCYCKSIEPFDCPIHFVILIHPIEVRRRIATGRMSHQCLTGSHLFRGKNFSKHSEVTRLASDPNYQSVVLYPSRNALNLSLLTREEKFEKFSRRKLRIFVIDGTWGTAKSMVNQSENLKNLPRICFTPERSSNFRVRKQPNEKCLSTIEAIHQTIEILGDSQGVDMVLRPHNRLIQIFEAMVDRQASFVSSSKRKYRSREKKRS